MRCDFTTRRVPLESVAKKKEKKKMTEEEKAPIPLRKTLVVVNNYLKSTTSFLNHFATLCEDKLRLVSEKIERVEITLSLLEHKLASVPELQGIGETAADDSSSEPAAAIGTGSPADNNNNNNSSSSDGSTSLGNIGGGAGGGGSVSSSGPPTAGSGGGSGAAGHSGDGSPTESPSTGVMKVKDDPEFATYFKMLRMRMPIGAIKNKMTMDGLDPSFIDQPDAPSPNAEARAASAGPSVNNNSNDNFNSKNDNDNNNDDNNSRVKPIHPHFVLYCSLGHLHA